MTLALLLTAVTGAWADGIVCTASDLGKVLCTDGSIYENVSAATTAGKEAAAVIAYVDETNKNGLAIALADEGEMNWSTAMSTCEGKTAIMGAKWCLPSQEQWKQMFKANGGNEGSYTGLNTTITNAGGTTMPEGVMYWSSSEYSPDTYAYNVWLHEGNANWNNDDEGTDFIQARACLAFDIASSTIDVTPVTGKTNEWTFAMPGSDVVLTPIYAKAAAFATTGTEPEVKTLLPEAAEGVIAGTDASLIAEGTGIVAFAGTSTEDTQGTLMYAIGTSATEAPALTDFSATVPTAKDIADDGATLYVWYYITGTDTPDGQEATAENTFNDSEICAQPLEVIVLSNKFDITFNAANANTIEAGKATVTVGGTAATVTDGKLEGVKMGSEVKMTAKQGYKFRKVKAMKVTYAEGHALPLAKFGEIVCSDGKAYAAADKDNLPKGVKAEALVCYVNGEHGLALAMADVKNAKMSWDNDRGANDGKTAAEWCDGWNTSHPIAGATWLLASQTQWNNMISAAGSASNLSNAFSAVGGTNLQAYSYWSSTPNHGGSAAWFYYFPQSSWQWTYLNQDYTGRYIRACLEW